MRVLGLAQQEMDRPIRSFTVTFENPIYDEASIAEAQARHVGSTYHQLPITGARSPTRSPTRSGMPSARRRSSV